MYNKQDIMEIATKSCRWFIIIIIVICSFLGCTIICIILSSRVAGTTCMHSSHPMTKRRRCGKWY